MAGDKNKNRKHKDKQKESKANADHLVDNKNEVKGTRTMTPPPIQFKTGGASKQTDGSGVEEAGGGMYEGQGAAFSVMGAAAPGDGSPGSKKKNIGGYKAKASAAKDMGSPLSHRGVPGPSKKMSGGSNPFKIAPEKKSKKKDKKENPYKLKNTKKKKSKGAKAPADNYKLPAKAKTKKKSARKAKAAFKPKIPAKKGKLPDEIQARASNIFSADFSSVKILENSPLAKKMGALAFTQGNSIHFAPGKYNPKSKEGMELIGHELTHVVQQREGKVKATGVENGNAVNKDKGLENEADEMGKKIASGDPFKRAVGGRNDKPKEDVIQKKGEGSEHDGPNQESQDPTSDSEGGENQGNEKVDPSAAKEEKGKVSKDNGIENPAGDSGGGTEDSGTPMDKNTGSLDDAPQPNDIPSSPNSGAGNSPDATVVSSGGEVDGTYTEMFNEMYSDVNMVKGIPVDFVEPPVDADAIPVPEEEVEKKEEIKEDMEDKVHEDNVESAKAANKFIAKSSNKTKDLINEGKEIPKKIEPAKNSAIGVVQGAVASEQGATRSAFSGFRSAVVSETAQVKGQIESNHQQTIASIQSTYAANVAAVESSYASSVAKVNAALAEHLAFVEAEFNSASQKILEIGKKSSAEAKAIGEAKAAEYRARPKGGMFSSKKKKNKARASAAISVAESYAKNLLEEAQAQSKDILKGKEPAKQQAREIAAQQLQVLAQQHKAALISLEETKNQAIQQTDAGKVEFINTLAQASTGSIMELEAKEGIQVESISKLGNQKIAVISALADEIASNLQKGTYEASESLLDEYKRFKEDVDGMDAPDAGFFQKSVDNVEKNVTKSIEGAEKMIDEGVSNASSGMMSQASGAASQMKSITGTGIADGQTSRQAFSTSAQGILSSARQAFAQFDQMHSQQSDGAKTNALDGFQQTVASTIEQFKSTAASIKQSLGDSVAKFNDAMQDTLSNKLPADIEKHAEEAASKVKGGFFKMLISIIIVVVVAVFLTPAVAGLVAGAIGAGMAATIVTAAIVGGITSALQTMANNVLTGQSLFSGVGKAFVSGAINGALSAGLGAAMGGTFDKLRGMVQAASPVVQQLANMGINFLQGVATDTIMALAKGDPINMGAILKSNAISAIADGAMETVDGFFEGLEAKVATMDGPMKILAEAGIDFAKGTAKDIIKSVVSGEDMDFGAILKNNAIGAAKGAASKGFEYLKGKAAGIENKALNMLATHGLGMLEGVTGDVLNALASGGDVDLGNILKMQAIGAVQNLGAEGFSMLKEHVGTMDDSLLKTVLDKGVDFGQGVAGDVLTALAKGEDVDLGSILKTQAIVSAKELTPALFSKLKDQVGNIDNSSMKYILEKGIEFGEGATTSILTAVESGGDVDFGEILKTQALVTGQDFASDGFNFLKNNIGEMEPSTAKYLLGHGLNFAEQSTNDVFSALQSGKDVDLGGILKSQGISSLQGMSPDLFNTLQEKVSGMDDGFMKYITGQGVDFAKASSGDILGALAAGNEVDLGSILKTQAFNSAQGMTPDLFEFVNGKIDGMDDGSMKYLLQQGSSFGEGSLNGILGAAQNGGDIPFGDIFKQQGILSGQRMAGDGLGFLQGKVDGMDSGLTKYLSGKGLEFAGGTTDDIFGSLLSGGDLDLGSILSKNGSATATSIGDDAKELILGKLGGIGGLLDGDTSVTSPDDLLKILSSGGLEGTGILNRGFNPLGLQSAGLGGGGGGGGADNGGLATQSFSDSEMGAIAELLGAGSISSTPSLSTAGDQLIAETVGPNAPVNVPIGVTTEEYILGSLSEQYETGGNGPGTVSSGIGDFGGVSYGSYQIIAGNMQAFFSGAGAEHAATFQGLTPGSPEFTTEWKGIADADPEAFHSLQHEYIQNTHFDVMVENISVGDNAIDGLEIAGRSNTLKDVAWSTAVQHGPNNKIFNRALDGMDVSSMTDSEIISSVYGERGKLNSDGDLAYFKSSSQAVQDGVANRFVNEEADALGMLEGELEQLSLLPVMPQNTSLANDLLGNTMNPYDSQTSLSDVLSANSNSFLNDMPAGFYPSDQASMALTGEEIPMSPIEERPPGVLERIRSGATSGWEKLFGEEGTVVDPTTEFSQEDLGMEYFAHGLAYIDQKDFESTFDQGTKDTHNGIISALGRDPDGIQFLDGNYDFQAVLIPGAEEGMPAVLAVRGTSSLMDAVTDADFKQVGNEQFMRNAEMITEALNSVDGKVIITGHSLGGAVSQIIAVNNPEKVDRVVTFQSPGIAGSEVQKYDDLPEDEKFRITHHQANNDIVDKAGWTHLPGTVYDHQLKDWVDPVTAHTSYVFGTDSLSDMRSAYGFTDEVLTGTFNANLYEGDPAVTKYGSYPDPLVGKGTEVLRKGVGGIKETGEALFEGGRDLLNWGKGLFGKDDERSKNIVPWAPGVDPSTMGGEFMGPYDPSYSPDSPFIGPLRHQDTDSTLGGGGGNSNLSQPNGLLGNTNFDSGDQDLAAVVTFDQYAQVFENPTDSWFDGGIDTEDIQELGRGEFDRSHVEGQLKDMGVPSAQIDSTIDEIVSAASIISNNSTLLRDLDSANDSDGDVDGNFSRSDSEAYIMDRTLATAQSTGEIVPERQTILDRFAETADQNYFHNSVSEVLNGNSRLGTLTDVEQSHMLETSLDSFMEFDSNRQSGSNYGAIINLGHQLNQSGNTQLINSYGESLLDRAIQLNKDAENYAGTGGTSDVFNVNMMREQAAFMSSQALMVMADADAQSTYMSNLSGENAYHLANSLALGDMRTGAYIHSGNNINIRVSATERFLQNITDSNITTDSSKTFVAEVFNDMTQQSYDMGSNPETVIANAMALQTHPNDPAARSVYSGQLGEVLNSDQGKELLSHNPGMHPAVREGMIQLFMEDPGEFVSNIRKHDGSGFTNPHLMIDYSKPRVLDFMHRGDEPQVITNSNTLQNLIGASMSIPVSGITDNMTETQIREMETAIASGTYDQSLYANSSEAMNSINPILNSINHFSGGGDAKVTVVPIQFSSEGSGPVDLPLYRVLDAGGVERFVDNQGGRYDSFDEWINENELPPGNVSFPTDGHLHDGSTPLTSRNTPKTRDTVGEYLLTGLDWAALAGGVVAGGFIIAGSGGLAAPLVAGAAGLYGAGRSGQQLIQSHDRGRSINPLTSWDAAGNWLGVAGGLLGAGTLASTARLGQGAAMTQRLGAAAGAADLLGAGHDTGTLVKDWSKLSNEQRAQLALKIMFYAGSETASRYYANRNAADGGTTTNTPEGTTTTPDGRTTTPETPGSTMTGGTPTLDTGGPGGRPSAPDGFEWVSPTNGTPYVRRQRGNGDTNPLPLERKPQIRYNEEANVFVHADDPTMVFNRDTGNFTGPDGGQYFYNGESQRFLPRDGSYPEAEFRAMTGEFDATQASRLGTAEEFYNTNKGAGDHDSELRGINFDQPVDVINQGRVDQDTFDMFVRIDETTGQPILDRNTGGIRFGSYFSNPGADPSALGIDVAGRVRIRVVLGDPPPMLRSQTVDITSWSGDGSVYGGGETQYFSPTANQNIVSYEIVTD